MRLTSERIYGLWLAALKKKNVERNIDVLFLKERDVARELSFFLKTTAQLSDQKKFIAGGLVTRYLRLHIIDTMSSFFCIRYMLYT